MSNYNIILYLKKILIKDRNVVRAQSFFLILHDKEPEPIKINTNNHQDFTK